MGLTSMARAEPQVSSQDGLLWLRNPTAATERGSFNLGGRATNVAGTREPWAPSY